MSEEGTGSPAVAPVTPWPARIAGALVVLAILAIIILAIRMKPGSPPVAPNAGEQVGYAQAPDQQTVQTVEAAAPTGQSETQSSQQVPQSPAPVPADTGVQEQPSPPPLPAQSTPDPAAAPAQEPAPQPSPAPTNQPAPASPSPAFTPREAEQVVAQAEATERGQIAGALGTLIAMLRQPEYQDPDNWQILQAALVTAGLSMIPGGVKQGHAEILAVISNSRNGAEAADRLERMGHQSAIPIAVQRQLVHILATATSYEQVINGMDQVLRSSGTQLSDQTVAQLRQAAARAWEQRDALRQQYGR